MTYNVSEETSNGRLKFNKLEAEIFGFGTQFSQRLTEARLFAEGGAFDTNTSENQIPNPVPVCSTRTISPL